MVGGPLRRLYRPGSHLTVRDSIVGLDQWSNGAHGCVGRSPTHTVGSPLVVLVTLVMLTIVRWLTTASKYAAPASTT
jgi:hypothetical protein